MFSPCQKTARYILLKMQFHPHANSHAKQVFLNCLYPPERKKPSRNWHKAKFHPLIAINKGLVNHQKDGRRLTPDLSSSFHHHSNEPAPNSCQDRHAHSQVHQKLFCPVHAGMPPYTHWAPALQPKEMLHEIQDLHK